MRTLHYRILNVFTRNHERISGNPLCVFEDGTALDDATMQALARQFNLSETTFILPSNRARTGQDFYAGLRNAVCRSPDAGYCICVPRDGQRWQ